MKILSSNTILNSFSLFFLLLLIEYVRAEDFYELLGVSKDADNRDIRKAFKKLALQWHPDKNKDNPEAHAKFLRLNKAYEVLKDEEKRKKYDLHGEEGLDESRSSGHYQSWSFYHEEFGIYDDDPEIVTLSGKDFEDMVRDSEDPWFINFYSPHCGHCHKLAPTWRKVARELEDVIRIGAVNCGDDLWLCRKESVYRFPTLKHYPGGHVYEGPETFDEMVDYGMELVKAAIKDVSARDFQSMRLMKEHSNWIVMFCWNQQDCPSWKTQKKLAGMLDDIALIGYLDCGREQDLCKSLEIPTNGEIRAYPSGIALISRDSRELTQEYLNTLQGPSELDAITFENILKSLMQGGKESWLLEFYSPAEIDDTLSKKLAVLLDSNNIRVGRMDCVRERAFCQRFFVHKYPTYMMLKDGGGHEIHLGRPGVHSVGQFAKKSSTATAFHNLNPTDFQRVQDGSSLWFVDFFAPWCPPCMHLYPEFRRASNLAQERDLQVRFGVVDCTIHYRLCNQERIHSYPSTILYNGSIPHHYKGPHKAESLVDFVHNILNPVAIDLTDELFERRVHSKKEDEIWVIDYYAPWCGPCMAMQSEFRKFAQMVKDIPGVYVGEVNCERERNLCHNNNIHSYPTIRLYPRGSQGIRTLAQYYPQWQRNAKSFQSWLFQFLPSNVEDISGMDTFHAKVLKSADVWLVDFYTPWCGHCNMYAPEFESIAQSLKGKVKAGKVNCEQDESLCHAAGVNAYPSVLLYKEKNGFHGVPLHNREAEFVVSFVEAQLKARGHLQRDEL